MKRFGFYFILVVSLLWGCGVEDQTHDLLIGRWDLKEAIRQNRVTSTLDGLFFDFTKDSLYTNNIFFGMNPYEYSKDTIRVLSADPYDLQVFSVDSAHLDLRGEIQNVIFFLRFEKIKP